MLSIDLSKRIPLASMGKPKHNQQKESNLRECTHWFTRAKKVIMADFDFDSLTDGLRKVFLAGVGAMATSAEKGKELIDELVRKGEITVDQGKALNTELSRKASTTAKSAVSNARTAFEDARDTVTRARLSAMSEAERKEYIDRIIALNEELSKKTENPVDSTQTEQESAPEVSETPETSETAAE